MIRLYRLTPPKERKVYMQALELFLSRFHKDELWAECLKCGRRYENEEHQCDEVKLADVKADNSNSEQMKNGRTSSETTVTHGTDGRIAGVYAVKMVLS